MSTPEEPANDAEPTKFSNPIPPVEDDYIDPDVEALLDFEPVPRAVVVEGSWTPELQRELIIRIAEHGSIQRACDDMGKNRTGVTRLMKHKQAESFNAAVAGALTLSRLRMEAIGVLVQRMEPGPTRPPVIDYRRKDPLSPKAGVGLPGQIINEHGEWEDEESYRRRGEEAKDNIAHKLVRIRRLYLHEISASAGKRAAFEILTQLPVDWEKAGKLEPQPFEPWTKTNQRQPDMVLTAESGWMSGMVNYGPPKVAELRATIDRHRAEQGLEPVDWEGEEGGDGASGRPAG